LIEGVIDDRSDDKADDESQHGKCGESEGGCNFNRLMK